MNQLTVLGAFPLAFLIALLWGSRSFFEPRVRNVGGSIRKRSSDVLPRLEHAISSQLLANVRFDRTPFVASCACCFVLALAGVAGLIPPPVVFALSSVVVLGAKVIEIRTLGIRFERSRFLAKPTALGIVTALMLLALGFWKGHPNPSWGIAAIGVLAASIADATILSPTSRAPAIDLADRYARRWIAAVGRPYFSYSAVAALAAVELIGYRGWFQTFSIYLCYVSAYSAIMVSADGVVLSREQVNALAYDIPANERGGLTSGPTV